MEEALKASANKTPVATTNTSDVASLEAALGNQYAFAMTQKPASKEEAAKQLEILDGLSKSIETKNLINFENSFAVKSTPKKNTNQLG